MIKNALENYFQWMYLFATPFETMLHGRRVADYVLTTKNPTANDIVIESLEDDF